MTERPPGGGFSAKHPPQTRVNPEILQKLDPAAENGRVTCAAMHRISAELGVAPAEVGVAADLRNFHIARCQLGLFGFRPEKKVVRPAESVPADLEAAIRGQAVDGRISCLLAWDIADRFKVPKMTVSAACEALGIKIKPCQLGAF